MSEEETPTPVADPAPSEPSPAAAEKPAPPPKPKPAPRQLPDEEGIARWIGGEDYPILAALFDQLVLPKYDGLFAQIKKQELLPQHWQVISTHSVPEGERFDELSSARRLRSLYDDPELSRRRLAALEVAWKALRGKRPTRWNASDVFAAIRRIIDKKHPVDYHDLLSAVRDVWRGTTLPQGREQLEVLWACLVFIRSKTRK